MSEGDDPARLAAGAPEVSVVIAAYDAAATLDAQLAALSRQRPGAAWEVLVCDNGSTDDTVRVALRWDGRLPGLRVVDASARRGAGAARNVGAAVARGRALVFCDADDVVGAGWLRAMVEALRVHEVAAGRFEDALLNDPAVRASRHMPQTACLQTSDLLPGLVHAGAGNFGVRREVFVALGGFDPSARYLEDTDLCWRLQLSGHAIAFVPDAVVHVRMRSGLSASLRQGFWYGTGERWLARRYQGVVAARAREGASAGERDVARRTGVVDQAASGVAAAPTAAAARVTAGVRRAVTRAGLVAAAVTRVRGRGDAVALCWSVGWGLGFALGVLPDPPAPVELRGIQRTSEL